MLLLLTQAACAPTMLRPIDHELAQAAAAGDVARVEAALGAGAATDVKGRGGWTPLMLAARNGDSSTVRALLKYGAHVNDTNDWGQTALMVCTASIVKLLADAGGDVNARNTKGDIPAVINGDTALMMTSDLDKTRALLQAGADVNEPSAWGATALTYAAFRGESARVTVLLEAGADVHVSGGRALIDAASQGDAPCVTLLLEAGADPHVRAPNGRTPLHFAATNLRRGVVEALLAAHPDVNSQSADGSTPLVLAARDGAVENVRALLAAGADPNIRNAAGQTAMDWATAKGNADLIAALHSGGASDSTATDGLEAMKRSARDERDAGLEIFATDVTTDGRVAKIRGRIRNTSAHRIEGIRYEVVLVEPASGRRLDTLHQDSDATLGPGQEQPLHLEIQSMYLGGGPRLLLGASPVKLTTGQ